MTNRSANSYRFRMRFALLALALVSCASDPSPAADGGPDAVAVDTGPGDIGNPVDLGSDTGPSPVDVVADAGQLVDAGAPIDTGSRDTGPADVDPRQSEVCRGVLAECDGRMVDVQRGERDGGRTYHCGGCGIICPMGSFCVSCVCER